MKRSDLNWGDMRGCKLLNAGWLPKIQGARTDPAGRTRVPDLARSQMKMH